MDPELQRQINQQRTIINETLRPQTVELAIRCRPLLGEREALEGVLQEAMRSLPFCKYLYILDAECHQITSNITRNGPQPGTKATTRLITTKTANAACDSSEYFLSHIGGIVVLQSCLPAPTVHNRTVELCESIPRIRVKLSDAIQQRRGRRA